MKTKLYILTSLLFSISLLLNGQSNKNFDTYGQSFDIAGINNYKVEKESLLNNPQDDTKLEGQILSTCPMKGCWMKMSVERDTILVRFKDYGFFVPKSGAEGKSAIINGKLSVDTLSVAQLRHYAEDAGKSKEEVLKIIKPEITISFLADGVVIDK
tara:strand:- start:49 stop:516 length:468 start_codon:yes stop_codon:yes gene_type:complete